MSHLDEGTLHALLDGELDLHEVKEIQAHIGSCAACGTRLREVKEFHGESDRLVGLLEVPVAPSRWTAVPDAEPDPVKPPRERAAPRPPRNLPRTSGPAAEPPPLLLPDNSEYGRGKFMRRMRWAAVLLVTVGAGYLGNQMRQSGGFEFEGLPVPGATTDSISGSVLSTEEAAPPAGTDTAAPAEPNDAARAQGNGAAPAERKSAPPVPKRVAPRAETPAPTAGESARAPALAKTADEEPESSLAADTVSGAGNLEDSAEFSLDETAEEEASPPQRQADVRTEAARALRELDRERQVDRAAAATAALDSARRREALVRQAATAAPAPRTPEQRARTYLRIGLDEASTQLGRPVHVIEGMSPLFMGLALGRTSPGADATRPVVRVVYQDSQGRLIFLDQQRLRPGQATSSPGADPHWIVGEVSLHLSGEVSPDVLRNLRARVR
jgi:hypothetical protein